MTLPNNTHQTTTHWSNHTPYSPYHNTFNSTRRHTPQTRDHPNLSIFCTYKLHLLTHSMTTTQLTFHTTQSTLSLRVLRNLPQLRFQTNHMHIPNLCHSWTPLSHSTVTTKLYGRTPITKEEGRPHLTSRTHRKILDQRPSITNLVSSRRKTAYRCPSNSAKIFSTLAEGKFVRDDGLPLVPPSPFPAPLLLLLRIHWTRERDDKRG